MLVKQMVIRVKIHFIWRLTSIFRRRAHPCLHLLHNCFYPVSRGPCSQGKLSREVMSHSLRHAKLFCLLSLELQIKFDKIGQCFSFSFLFLAIFALCKSFHFALFLSSRLSGTNTVSYTLPLRSYPEKIEDTLPTGYVSWITIYLLIKDKEGHILEKLLSWKPIRVYFLMLIYRWQASRLKRWDYNFTNLMLIT